MLFVTRTQRVVAGRHLVGGYAQVEMITPQPGRTRRNALRDARSAFVATPGAQRTHVLRAMRPFDACRARPESPGRNALNEPTALTSASCDAGAPAVPLARLSGAHPRRDSSNVRCLGRPTRGRRTACGRTSGPRSKGRCPGT